MSGYDDTDRNKEGKLPKDPDEGTIPFDQFEAKYPKSKKAADFTSPPASGSEDSTSPPSSKSEDVEEDFDDSIGALRPQVMKRLRARRAGIEKQIKIPWPELEQATGGGLWAEEMLIIVANTASGKTQLALQLALHAARHGAPCLYIGLELKRLDSYARVLGLMSGEKWSRYYHGSKDANLEAADALYGPELEKLPFHMAFAPPRRGWRPADLAPRLARLRKLYPLDTDANGKPIPGSRPILVVLDFLQLVGGEERELRERIGNAAYAFKATAEEFESAIILISSTARANYAVLAGGKDPSTIGTDDPTQYVGTGKESGDQEYACDYEWTLHKAPWVDGKPPKDGTVIHVGISKVRARSEGASDWVKLSFDGSQFKPYVKSPEAVQAEVEAAQAAKAKKIEDKTAAATKEAESEEAEVKSKKAEAEAGDIF